MSLFSYWGKSDSKNPSIPSYHPLVYHSLDVAACGRKLLDKRPDWLGKLSVLSGIPEADFIPWATFLLAIHDIGKFSDGFQNQIPDLFQKLQSRSTNAGYGERHDTLGFRYACDNISKIFSSGNRDKEDLKDLLKPWLGAVTGHHGRPPDPPMNPVPLSDQFPSKVQQDILEFIKTLQTVLLPQGLPFKVVDYDLHNERFIQSSWLMAGFAVLADWLGSNRNWFPYTLQKEDSDLRTYWVENSAKAEKAMRESGLWPRQASNGTGISVLFPKKFIHPTPLQRLTDELPLTAGQQLAVIEEITGSGKTEAALNLAHRWMAAGLGTGIYFALPSMATANAMYDRLRENYKNFFKNGQEPSLVLAHSAARMRLELEDKNKSDQGYRDGVPSASQDCSAWLSDSRKKALLADFGVGTIDQALLGVLPARHQSLRLWGLAPKILVVDEVHACDAYVLKLLENLLKFHAAFGGSAILLSATLPKHMRSRLLRAFAQGTGWGKVEVKNESYPLFTRLSKQGLEEENFTAREDLARQVGVEMFHSEPPAKDRLREVVEKGGCACWVRNTVVDAIEAYREMSEMLGKDRILLFHARFALGDRLGLEDKVKALFGPDSGPGQRSGKLLIATQVVEQSLDLDFDYMLTDLAPMDLIIQRAGRLRRHKRDRTGRRIMSNDQRGEIILGVLGPSAEKAGRSWYSGFFPKAEKVYPHHGRLWLTAKWLEEHNVFNVPGDMRAMIEAVYREDATGEMPEPLAALEDQADGKDAGDKSLAQLNGLVLETGYNKVDGRWEDTEAPTRLGEPTVRVRLVRQNEKKDWEPWRRDTGSGHDWELSQLAVRRYWANQESSRFEADISKLKKQMPDEGRYCLVIPLEKKDGSWKGSVLNSKNKEITVSYDETTGFQMLGEVGE